MPYRLNVAIASDMTSICMGESARPKGTPPWTAWQLLAREEAITGELRFAMNADKLTEPGTIILTEY